MEKLHEENIEPDKKEEKREVVSESYREKLHRKNPNKHNDVDWGLLR